MAKKNGEEVQEVLPSEAEVAASVPDPVEVPEVDPFVEEEEVEPTINVKINLDIEVPQGEFLEIAAKAANEGQDLQAQVLLWYQKSLRGTTRPTTTPQRSTASESDGRRGPAEKHDVLLPDGRAVQWGGRAWNGDMNAFKAQGYTEIDRSGEPWKLVKPA